MISLNSPAAAGTARAESAEQQFSVNLHLDKGFEQIARFDSPGIAPLIVDEPAPLGENRGPNPARVLASAVGSCLAASLLFCLRKVHIDVRGLETTVHGSLVRNERGRLRMGPLRVSLNVLVPSTQHSRVPRCIELFEDFCVVTASVRASIPVEVNVEVTAPADV